MESAADCDEPGQKLLPFETTAAAEKARQLVASPSHRRLLSVSATNNPATVCRSAAVVLVDIGIDQSTGEPTEARLLPHYRGSRRQLRKRREEDGDDEIQPSSTVLPSATVVNELAKTNALPDNNALPEKVERTHLVETKTAADEEDNTGLQRSPFRRGRLRRSDTRPLLQEQPIDGVTGLLDEDRRTGKYEEDSQSGGVVEGRLLNTDVVKRERKFTSSYKAVRDRNMLKNAKPGTADGDDRNSTKSADAARARRHWSRLSALVPSLGKSDNTGIANWSTPVMSRSGNRRNGNIVDIRNPHPASFELVSANSSLSMVTVDCGNDDHSFDVNSYKLALDNTQQVPSAALDATGLNDKEDDDDVIHRRRLRIKQCTSCCRKLIAFLFSTVGSCCVLVGYVIIGGFVFRGLEAENELLMKTDMRQVRLEHVHRLWNVTETMNVLHPDAWNAEAERIFTNFTTQVYNATKRNGWDGKYDNSEQQWSFAGAMLYSITVITTIGYGHIAPKTTSGQVVTMLYAIVGIPLTLFTITNLGAIMATAFRFLYKFVCCGLCCVCCCRRRRRSATHRKNRRKRLLADAKTGDREEDCGIGGKKANAAGQKHTKSNFNFDDVEVVDREDETLRQRIEAVFAGTTDIRKVSVPIYVSLLLMTGYILLGATLFWLSEDEWNFVVSAYFCFITLSTIGFGDYVPGNDFTVISPLPSSTSSSSSSPSDSTSSASVTSSFIVDAASELEDAMDTWRTQKLVICALYLVCGLALIAMCFDLMQEEAKNKFRRLGRRLGLISDEN